jgi:hypothetical protein
MEVTADRVLDDALQLNPQERARVAAALLATLEPDVPAERRSEAEWLAEVERRARSALSGAPGVSWPEAEADIRRRLSGR